MNVTLFLAALEGFEDVLDRSHTAVRDAYDALADAYHALRAEWEGEGAEEFFAAWLRAGDAIGAYTEGAPALVDLLDRKIAELRPLDRGVG